ncbi:MAG: Flp pilus assembly protein CpaB [Candidatus Dormibacteria bacterium]
MAIQPNKPQNRVFLLVGLVLAAAAAVAVLFAVSHSSSSVPSTSIVVAKTTISAGTTITSDMLTTQPYPNTNLPADPYGDPAQVVGKTTPVTISANTPITQSVFASATTVAGPNGTQVVVTHLDITKGYVAMAIPAAGTASANFTTGVSAELTSVGYYIQPEDHIDILIDPGLPSGPGVRFSFQDVRVLRVGTSSGNGASSTGAPTVYIVELPRNQAELLTAITTGRGGNILVLKYVLRPQSEYGKSDGSNGYDKPNYEPATGSPLTLAPDTTVTAATLNSAFGH